MLDLISQIDKELLLAINGFNSHIADELMLLISSKLGWIPLYLFLLYKIIIDYKNKTWLILLAFGLAILLADQSSVHLFKNTFKRLRPCYVDELNGLLHMVKYCGGKYGFVSSHAANSFSVATLVILFLKDKHKWIWPLMIFYATIIIYSRVYLGVHYPSDVIFGSILGILIGVFCFWLYVKIDKQV